MTEEEIKALSARNRALIKESQNLAEIHQQIARASFMSYEYTNDAYTEIASDLEEFRRLITDVYCLINAEMLDGAHRIYGEKLISTMLTHPKEFKRLVKNNHDLALIKKHYPNFNDQLITQLTSDIENFRRLIPTIPALIKIAKEHPNHAEALIGLVLPNPEEFNRLIRNNNDLIATARHFSNHAETLITRVLSNPEEFNRFIQNNDDLITTATHFPTHAEALITRVLSNPEEFNRFIQNNDNLITTATHFPTHAEALITRVLSNPEEFNRLIRNNHNLIETARHFSNHAETLITRVLSNPEEFNRFIQNNDSLRTTAKHFPNHADAILERVINNPERLKHLIRNQANFDKLKNALPHCTILQSTSYKEALEKFQTQSLTPITAPQVAVVYEEALEKVQTQSLIPTTAPQVAVVNNNENFQPLFLSYIKGETLSNQEKNALLEALLQKGMDEDITTFITNTLKYCQPKKLAALKEDLIALINNNENTKTELKLIRAEETKNKHEQVRSYLTFILGLGRSHFTFKLTESLTKLDVALGLIEKPSLLGHSYTRLTRWATQPKVTNEATSSYPASPKKGSQ